MDIKRKDMDNHRPNKDSVVLSFSTGRLPPKLELIVQKRSFIAMKLMRKRMKDLRIGINLNQHQVGEILYLGKDVYGRYERGDAVPPADIMFKLSVLYGVSINFLYGIDDERLVRCGTLSYLNEDKQLEVLKLIEDELKNGSYVGKKTCI